MFSRQKLRPIQLVHDDRNIEIPIRESARARKLSLRVDPSLGGASMVVPIGVRQSEAEEFAQRSVGWISQKLEKMPAQQPFEDGAVIPLLGRPHVIRHCDKRKPRHGVVWCEETADGPPVICVSGQPEHVSRRLTDWLKKEARRIIANRARGFASDLGESYSRISIRDTRTRWGSCSAGGNLSFSWRLILAPDHVLTYVAAHEVAHLREHNHSPRFWRVVDELIDDAKQSRAWLKRHGAELHRYG